MGEDVICRFRRNKNGKLDKDGAYRDVEAKKVNCKYDKEIRLLLGVASIKHSDGRVEGKRAKLFSYTGKTIITQNDYEKKIADEI